jgi:hypothetical protein
MQYAWTCACCGKQFDTLPIDWAFDAPSYWNDIPEAERAARGKLSPDFCVADEHYFIRGCLKVPITDFDGQVVWGVWVSQSADSFARAVELFDRDPDPDEEPRFGWLSNEIPVYHPSTLYLRTTVHFQPLNNRPLIELEPTDHPLAVEQRDGITLERVQEIVAAMMPRH